MKLYCIPFACSQAVHILLNELQLDFELITVDSVEKIASDGKNYLLINPNGYVPALALDTGEVVTEVPAVLQYLQAVYGNGKFQTDHTPLEQARLNALLNFLSSELHKAFVPFWYQPDLSQQDRQIALAKLEKRMDYLEQLLSDGRSYLTGSDYSVADIYAYVLISWCKFHQIEITPWKHISTFMQQLSQRPAISQAVQREDQLANQ